MVQMVGQLFVVWPEEIIIYWIDSFCSALSSSSYLLFRFSAAVSSFYFAFKPLSYSSWATITPSRFAQCLTRLVPVSPRSPNIPQLVGWLFSSYCTNSWFYDISHPFHDHSRCMCSCLLCAGNVSYLSTRNTLLQTSSAKTVSIQLYPPGNR